jgi:hypothetical protein
MGGGAGGTVSPSIGDGSHRRALNAAFFVVGVHVVLCDQICCGYSPGTVIEIFSTRVPVENSEKKKERDLWN